MTRVKNSIGATMYGWVANPTPTSTAAQPRAPRRHAATPNSTNIEPHANDCCPNSNAPMNVGSASAAAAHHPRRSSGNATNVATRHPTTPSIVHNVTAQSPNRGQTSAAVVQFTKPYGYAYASP